jgi:anaerobic selenocysteine-containing dehydrogenase
MKEKRAAICGTPGRLCVRGKHATEVLYSPDRLKTPLIRTGSRGEGKFRNAEWDKALDIIVANLQRLSCKGFQHIHPHLIPIYPAISLLTSQKKLLTPWCFVARSRCMISTMTISMGRLGAREG